jgi:hypothetical protein
MTNDYISAMKKISDQSSANAESDSSKVSTHTLKIVEDLLNVVDKKSGARPFPPKKWIHGSCVCYKEKTW